MSRIPVALWLLGALAVLYAPVLAWQPKAGAPRAHRTVHRLDNHT